MVVECCVPYCKTKAKRDFHNFPANKKRRLRWLKAIQIFHWDEGSLSNSYRRICKKHFSRNDYWTHANGSLRLKHDCVPTQNLNNPIWMEHSYVSRSNKIDANTSKAEKELQIPAAAERDMDSNESAVSFGQGIVDTSSKEKSHKEEVQALKKTILELKEKLRDKDRLIYSINKKLRLKDNVLKSLRQKAKANQLNKNNVMRYLRQTFDKGQLLFFEMQMKNVNKKKNAKRYTPDEKSFCLAIYKHSPKTYKLLRRYFILPSKRTLGRHSAKMMFESGINANFFDYLKTTVKDMDDIDKNCILIWDEMSLKPHLDYNEKRDIIDGFMELILTRRPKFATHALTFMVRGIKTAYKEPVAYFYTDGLKHFELVEMVKLVGEAVLDTGLKIIGSACDQDGTNVATVNKLMGKKNTGANDGQLLTYKLRDTTIIHCWDIPHLIKGTRNNLQTKYLKHFLYGRWPSSNSKSPKNVDEKKGPKASWNDVSDLYDLSLKGSKTLLPKITPEHIAPNRLKMKVSVTTQVFSQTYGNLMLHCSEKKHLLRDCSGTAQILLFFNDLFDSMNGSLQQSMFSMHRSPKIRFILNIGNMHWICWRK